MVEAGEALDPDQTYMIYQFYETRPWTRPDLLVLPALLQILAGTFYDLEGHPGTFYDLDATQNPRPVIH